MAMRVVDYLWSKTRPLNDTGVTNETAEATEISVSTVKKKGRRGPSFSFPFHPPPKKVINVMYMMECFDENAEG